MCVGGELGAVFLDWVDRPMAEGSIVQVASPRRRIRSSKSLLRVLCASVVSQPFKYRARLLKSSMPSSDPCQGREARSGCGMRPKMRPVESLMPAMPPGAPLGQNGYSSVALPSLE